MINKPFVINSRFSIHPQLGLIKQTEPTKETRIEPRLMNLLCILASKQGELVSRELLTKEVWNDYGNADEGLTQAISYLRKVFNDDTKTLIETVPKKGYVLHAVITTAIAVTDNARIAIKKKQYLLIVATILVLAIAAYLFFFAGSRNADEIQGNPSINAPGSNPDVIKEKPKQSHSDDRPDTVQKTVQSPDVKK